MAKSTAEFNLFYHDCLEASFRASSSVAEYLAQNEVFFEIHVTPKDPQAEKIAPVIIKSDYIREWDGFETGKRTSPPQSTHKTLLKKALYIRKKLIEQYKGKDYSVHITWKMGDN